MTVQEIIDALGNYPRDMEVKVQAPGVFVPLVVEDVDGMEFEQSVLVITNWEA